MSGPNPIEDDHFDDIPSDNPTPASLCWDARYATANTDLGLVIGPESPAARKEEMVRDWVNKFGEMDVKGPERMAMTVATCRTPDSSLLLEGAETCKCESEITPGNVSGNILAASRYPVV